MILPTKHIPAEHTLLGVGAVLLPHMTRPHTVSSLWEIARKHPSVGTFDRYVLTLDLLHMLGALEFQADGLVTRGAR